MKIWIVLLSFWLSATSVAEVQRNLDVIPASSGKRVALVIGNGAYPGAGVLRNPTNDATDFAASLKKMGFDVTLRTDMPYREMLRSLTEFGEKVNVGSEALFFYAGHGMQVRGRNYLIPIDAEIRSEGSVSSEAVDVDQLLDKLSLARLSIVILDACRNNPFEQKFRGGGQGLAQINAPTGTIIAYATAPGKVAADGKGRNGLYTGELLAAMDVPRIKIEDVFKRVRINVVNKSAYAQTPWESSSLTGDFFFRMDGDSLSPQIAEPADIATVEIAFWESIKDSSDADDFQSYLNRYPNGQFVDLAERRLKRQSLMTEPQLTGKWSDGLHEFYVASTAEGLKLSGLSLLTTNDVKIEYTTWGDRFASQSVPIQFTAKLSNGSIKGVWKRDAFKAATCNIPEDEGDFEGDVSPEGKQMTLRFLAKKHKILMSRQMLWEDECRDVSVDGIERKEIVLYR